MFVELVNIYYANVSIRFLSSTGTKEAKVDYLADADYLLVCGLLAYSINRWGDSIYLTNLKYHRYLKVYYYKHTCLFLQKNIFLYNFHEVIYKFLIFMVCVNCIWKPNGFYDIINTAKSIPYAFSTIRPSTVSASNRSMTLQNALSAWQGLTEGAHSKCPSALFMPYFYDSSDIH